MSADNVVVNGDHAPAQQVQDEVVVNENGLENGVAGLKVDEQVQSSGQVNGDAQVNGSSIPVPEIELHRACVSGNLEEVRAVLSRGLEALEVLDQATGCTPIVLAIRNGHIDVVRELLTAGAIVPPPGLTADPNMLALLYPPHMYGIPPPFQGGMPMSGPEYYQGPQNGFYSNGHDHHAPYQQRRESPNGNAAPANLPPAEVSKTIPCRNFPNCKYGAGCVFFHPQQAFYPGPLRNGFVGGFEGYPQPGYQNGPYYVPNGFNSFPPPPPPETQQAPVPTENGEAQTSETQVSAPSAEASSAPIPVSQPPSAVAPVFVPQFAPHMGSPPPPSQFGLSPLSPSMLAGSLPSIPPAEAFFAQSPPNGFAPPAPFNPRRQSFGQPFNGPKPFHTKKPSFSNGGAPRPFRSSAGPNPNLGQWKDGAPPPCAFFAQGKCRNGEYCKFPHLDAENNDVRHPDVVRGVIAPLPSLGRQNRGMRMSLPNGQFGYDQGYRQPQSFAPQVNGNGPSPVASAIPEGEVAATEPAIANGSEVAQPATEEKSEADPTPAKAAAPMPSIVRSASQPGVQRVHANGFSSRSHSPAPSNASFHGNGHPRRGGARVPYINGQRSSSHGETKQQRVPGADEFPALAGATSPVLNGSAGEKKDGKTAAQVLSAPAPYRPKAALESPAESPDAQSIKSEGSVSMEDEEDSDAVIVSHKPSPAPTPSAAATAAAKKSSVSFASVISATSAAAPEATPVGVQA